MHAPVPGAAETRNKADFLGHGPLEPKPKAGSLTTMQTGAAAVTPAQTTLLWMVCVCLRHRSCESLHHTVLKS